MRATKYTSVFVIVLFAFVGLIFWYSQTKVLNQSLNTQASRLGPVQRSINFFSRPTPPSEPKNLAFENQTPSSSAAISNSNMAEAKQAQEQLLDEREKFNNLEIRLQSLKARYAQEVQQVSLTYPSKALDNSNQIQQLMSLLQEQQLAKGDISELVQNSFREQGQEAQAARDQIEQEIQTVQNQFSQVLQQIDYQMFLPPPGNPDQIAEYQNLFEQRSQMLQQLAILRQQKAEISINALSRTQAVNQQSQNVKTDLLENQTAIRDQITLLQNENVWLQQARNQIRMSSRSLVDQIGETQSNLNEQQERVQIMETQIISSQSAQ